MATALPQLTAWRGILTPRAWAYTSVMDPTLLAELRALCPLTDLQSPDRSLGAWVEHIFWQLVQQKALAAAELLAARTSRLDFGDYTMAFVRNAARVYDSTVASKFMCGTWFDLARELARHTQTQVCHVITYILQMHAGSLLPCSGIELLMRLYVTRKHASEYAIKILRELSYPRVVETFTDVCGNILCPPHLVLKMAGLCDSPIVCQACAVSPGSCRLYSLIGRVTKTELFDVCATHGLTVLALECIVEARPSETAVQTLFRHAICASHRCNADIATVITGGLDGLERVRFQLDEQALLEFTLQKDMVKQVSAAVLIGFVRAMSRRPSWNHARFMDKIVARYKEDRGKSATAKFISDHLLPFMTTLHPVLQTEHPAYMHHTLMRVDADHALVRVLQHTGPLVAPAVHMLFCTLDHLIVTLK